MVHIHRRYTHEREQLQFSYWQQIYQASLIKNGICIACCSMKTTVRKPCQFNFVNSMLLVSLRINLKRGMGGRQFIVNSFCRMVYLKGYPGSNYVCCQKRSKRSSLKTKHTDQCVDKRGKTSLGFGFPSFKTCIYERNIRACSTNSPFRSHGVSWSKSWVVGRKTQNQIAKARTIGQLAAATANGQIATSDEHFWHSFLLVSWYSSSQ